MRETALRGGEARGHPTTTAAAKGEEKGKKMRDVWVEAGSGAQTEHVGII